MKKFLLFILNILKHIFLFTFYCSLPNKYSGETYEEWLGEKSAKNDEDDESKYYK